MSKFRFELSHWILLTRLLFGHFNRVNTTFLKFRFLFIDGAMILIFVSRFFSCVHIVLIEWKRPRWQYQLTVQHRTEYKNTLIFSWTIWGKDFFGEDTLQWRLFASRSWFVQPLHDQACESPPLIEIFRKNISVLNIYSFLPVMLVEVWNFRHCW